MADVEQLLKEAVGELDRLLKARNVLGEPVTHGEVTVVPIVSFGFGFGGGGGEDPKAGGRGAGTGGGGGIKPLALLILDKDGARVEPIRRGRGTVEALGTLAGKIAEAMGKGAKQPEPQAAEQQGER